MTHRGHNLIVAALTAGVATLAPGAAPASAASQTFSNASTITVPLGGSASPYPSTITARGLCGNVSGVRVTLRNVTHEFVRDIDVLLAGPQGQRSIVMSDAGSETNTGAGVTDRSYSFDDLAPAKMTPGVTPASGLYKPSNISGQGETSDTFPASAPAGPYLDTFSVFEATAPNGTWSLYVVDDDNGGQGTIYGGWELTLTTDASCATPTPPAAPAPVADTTKPALGAIGLSRSTFAAASSGAAFSAKKKRRKTPVGTKVSFTLSEASAVRFAAERKVTGRRTSGKCRSQTRKNRSKPGCTLWRKVAGSFTVPGKAGRNSFTFRGRIAGRRLRPGTYRLSATAADAAKNASLPRRKGFTIVR